MANAAQLSNLVYFLFLFSLAQSSCKSVAKLIEDKELLTLRASLECPERTSQTTLMTLLDLAMLSYPLNT